jgi:hypothetical protein
MSSLCDFAVEVTRSGDCCATSPVMHDVIAARLAKKHILSVWYNKGVALRYGMLPFWGIDTVH